MARSTSVTTAEFTRCRSSWSSRSSCCCRAMMRVLVVVGRVASTTSPTTSTPTAASASEALPRLVRANDADNLDHGPQAGGIGRGVAGAARHPGALCSSTTGTGASGEMRRTPPQMYSSSMTSPTTRTRRPRQFATTSSSSRCITASITRHLLDVSGATDKHE